MLKDFFSILCSDLTGLLAFVGAGDPVVLQKAAIGGTLLDAPYMHRFGARKNARFLQIRSPPSGG